MKQYHRDGPVMDGTNYYCQVPNNPRGGLAADRMQLGGFHPIIWLHPHIYPPTSWPLIFGVHLMDLKEIFQKTAFWQKVENLYGDLMEIVLISQSHSSYPALMISAHICSNGGGRGVLSHTHMLIRDCIAGEYVGVLKYECGSHWGRFAESRKVCRDTHIEDILASN